MPPTYSKAIVKHKGGAKVAPARRPTAPGADVPLIRFAGPGSKAYAPRPPPAGGGVAGQWRGAEASLSRYLHMVANPGDCTETELYPDETNVLTCGVHLKSTYTWVQNGTDMVTSLRGRMATCRAWGGTQAGGTWAYPQAVGVSPSDFGDYGSPHTSFVGNSIADRTLAAGVNIRIEGLPAGQFMATGTFYFLQLSDLEDTGAARTEQDCSQLLSLGRGFTCSADWLRCAPGGESLSLMAAGPQDYLFLRTDNVDSQISPAVSGSVSGAIPMPQQRLVVYGFGLTTGTTLRITYAHHVEFQPTTAAAGILAPKNAMPSSRVREGVARFSNALLGAISGGAVGSSGGTYGAVAGAVIGATLGGLNKEMPGPQALQGLFPAGAGAAGKSSGFRGSAPPAWRAPQGMQYTANGTPYMAV